MRSGFDKIKDALDAMKMEKVPDGNRHKWLKVVVSNEDFGLCDYGYGLLRVRISLGLDHGLWKIYFHVGNIDDGDWLAVEAIGRDTPEACLEKMDRIAHNILASMVKIPSEERLNELLRPFSMYGTF